MTLVHRLVSSNTCNPTYLDALKLEIVISHNNIVIAHYEDGDKIILSKYNPVAGVCNCCDDMEYSTLKRVVRWDLYEISLELA